jgi:hypothetical protein
MPPRWWWQQYGCSPGAAHPRAAFRAPFARDAYRRRTRADPQRAHARPRCRVGPMAMKCSGARRFFLPLPPRTSQPPSVTTRGRYFGRSRTERGSSSDLFSGARRHHSPRAIAAARSALQGRAALRPRQRRSWVRAPRPPLPSQPLVIGLSEAKIGFSLEDSTKNRREKAQRYQWFTRSGRGGEKFFSRPVPDGRGGGPPVLNIAPDRILGSWPIARDAVPKGRESARPPGKWAPSQGDAPASSLRARFSRSARGSGRENDIPVGL